MKSRKIYPIHTPNTKWSEVILWKYRKLVRPYSYPHLKFRNDEPKFSNEKALPVSSNLAGGRIITLFIQMNSQRYLFCICFFFFFYFMKITLRWKVYEFNDDNKNKNLYKLREFEFRNERENFLNRNIFFFSTMPMRRRGSLHLVQCSRNEVIAE